MDISEDARIYPFSIGPSTVLGRTIAFKILCRKSMKHLGQKLLRILSGLLYRLWKFFRPYVSWLHPRNPRGVLAMVAIISFVLKYFTNVKSRAELAYQRKFWKNVMKSSLSYEEWAHAAKMLDKHTMKAKDSALYDEELVRNKLRELQHRRENGSLRDVVFYMRADLFRNLGNMCNPELHKGRLQVPQLIREYIDEVSMHLRVVCESECEDLLLEEKLAFMHETRHAFGRTALLLSGGASLGVFHFGVVKTLVEQKLLPRIITGTSAGSIVCSIVGTKSWPELQSFFEDSSYTLEFFDHMGGIFTVVKRIMRRGALHEIRQLQMILRNLTNNLTFQEAYDMTGRVLGITVCSPRKHEPPRCLNYLTSPHVVIWSAVTASCAFPGLFEAQELMAKNRSGELVPYHPPFHLDPEEGTTITARRWRDGGLEMDLPMTQLKELFNVNHFIVSQANPHASAILRFKDLVRAYGGSFAAKLAHIVEMEVKHRCNQMLQLGLPFQGVAKVLIQEWEGDITVVVPASPVQYMRLMQNPSHVDVQRAANQGRRCIWEKLSAIKANCGVELALDECVSILNRIRRHKRSIQKAASASSSQIHASTSRFSASARIPSWNCIARENSASSLEDEFRPYRHRCNSEASIRTDVESETIDVRSWTQSGGPLMRTTSADLFVDFIQSLDLDCKESLSLTMLDSNDTVHRTGMANSSIMVTEGDLLQPERIHNGIVFNVVRRSDFPAHGRDHDDVQIDEREEVECLQLEETDDGLGSDCEDDSVSLNC